MRYSGNTVSHPVSASVARAPNGLLAIPLILASLIFVLPTPSLTVHVAKQIVLSVLFAANTRWCEPRAWYAFVLFLVVLLVSFIPALHTWNTMMIPATGFALIAYFQPKWLAADRWLVRGRASRATWALFALTIPLSAGALLGWAHVAQPNLTIYAGMIPGTGLGIVIGAAIVFSLFNAIAEEVVFRGVLWQALSDTRLTVAAVLIIQAAAFGILHYDGVPNGIAGIGLSTIYGAALGGIRLLSRGLLMPIIVHIFADLTIFLIVMRLAERW